MKTAMRKALESSAKFLGLIISSGLVGGVVAGLVTVYLTEKSSVRIENSRLSYEQRVKVVDQFDVSYTELLQKVGLFNNDTLTNKKVDPARRADVMQALVKAQVAANDLEDIVPASDKKLVEEYKTDLTALTDATQAVGEPLALGGVFDSVNKLLHLHDQIGTDTRASLRVRGLFGS